MSKSRVHVSTLILVLGLLMTPASASPASSNRCNSDPCVADTSAFPNPAKFPTGFGFPTTLAAPHPTGGQGEREHAWKLFVGLHQIDKYSNKYIYRTWPTSSQAFPYQYNNVVKSTPGTPGTAVTLIAKNDSNNPTALPGPVYKVPAYVAQNYPHCVINGKLKDGPTLETNGDIMVAGVPYNKTAFDWIKKYQFYDAAVLDKMVPPNDHDPSHQLAPPAPYGSIILKPQLWPVQGSENGPAYTALPVWDDLLPSASNRGGSEPRYSGYEVKSLWSRAVAITTDEHVVAGSSATVTYLASDVYKPKPHDTTRLGPITYENAQVVSINDFYHIRYTQAELDKMACGDRALLDASAIWNYGRSYEAQDALVLVAMHIISKEKFKTNKGVRLDWTFQSAWWHDKAHLCPKPKKTSVRCQLRYGNFRPVIKIDGKEVPDTWQNYLIVTTYGKAQAPGNINTWPTDLTAQDNKWPVAYNPYIELAAHHEIATNCRNCHHRAGWPGFLGGHGSSKFPGRKSSYLLQAAGAPDTLDVLKEDNWIFNGLLTLDSMWAIADRAAYALEAEAESGGSEESEGGYGNGGNEEEK